MWGQNGLGGGVIGGKPREGGSLRPLGFPQGLTEDKLRLG